MLFMVILLLDTLKSTVVNANKKQHQTPPPGKTTMKHLNKHVDSLSNAIEEEQEIEQKNAEELCTSDLNAKIYIKMQNRTSK